MKKTPVRIRKIHVREAPGIGCGLEPLADLSPGINVIYGPNGSGKSTTLRLMQASLSPGSSSHRFRGDRVETLVDLDGEVSTVNLRDLERVPDGIVEVGVELVRDCRFRLKELMDASSDAEYGRLFNEAAAGGLDLVQVAQSLGLNNHGNPRPIDRKELLNLSRKLVEAENNLSKLDGAKRELSQLEAEHDRLKSDIARSELLRNAIRHREKMGELERARIRLGDFPPCMKNLVGGELEELKAAEEQLSTSSGKLKQLRDAWHREIRNRKHSALGNPVAPGLLKYLDERKVALDNLERELQSKEITWSGVAEKMREAHEFLGDQVPDNLLKAADASLLNDLEQWCDRVEDYQGRVAAIGELEQDLGDLSPTFASGASKDIQLLRDWLAADRAQARNQKLGRLLLVTALVVLIVSLILGIVVHHVGFSGLLGAACLGLVWLQFRTGHEEECRREAEEKCQQQPEVWTRQAVNRLLEQLERQYAEELERQQRITRWKTVLNNRKTEIAEEFENLNQKAEELSNGLGFTPLVGSKSFGMLARAIIDWQEAFRESLAAAAAADKVREDMRALRTKVAEKLHDLLGPETAHDFDSAELAGWIADLRDRDQKYQNACRCIESGKRDVSTSLREIRAARRQISSIYGKIAPNSPDEAQLRELLRRLDDYHRVRDEVTAYGQSEREAQSFFNQHPDLASRGLDEMGGELEKIGTPTDRLNEVNQKIGGIKESLRSARNSTDVEDRMIEFEDRRASLQIEREQMLSRVAGMALAEQVQRKVAEKNVPLVQRRAGELLRDFTRGTCELVVDESRVKALQPGEGQQLFKLEELSDGTRVQLFMAVRLAFVEQGEKGLRLPLFFDEAFANTDTERGRKIMESLLEISRQGRQVFCFTSQAGEFARWRDFITGMKESEARLLTIRKTFAQPTVQADLRPPERYPQPSENQSLREYAEAIGVWQKINPWIASVDEVPVVYLVENPTDLRFLLEASIRTWGPLARLGPQECLLETGEVAFDKARRRAEFIYGVCSLWQRGRGRPITRELLAEAGVTNTASAERLEETWRHAERLGRDSGRLCKALEQGEVSVSRLGSKLIAELREFCEEKGLIVPDEPMTDGELRLRAVNLSRQLGLSDTERDRLLQQFTTEEIESGV